MTTNETENQTKWKIWGLVIVCLVTWVMSHVLQGRWSPFDASVSQQLGCMGTAVSAGAIAVYCYNRWLWRWRWLHPWFEAMPIVVGEYEGVVCRLFRDGKEEKVEFPVRVEIFQPTINRIFYRQKSLDGTAVGYTEACQLYWSGDAKIYLEGIYVIEKNEHHPSSMGELVAYFGAMRLELDNEIRPTALDGRYWSNKFTRGTMKLKRTT